MLSEARDRYIEADRLAWAHPHVSRLQWARKIAYDQWLLAVRMFRMSNPVAGQKP